ncbi:MAG: hypothetical protein ABI658_32605 [Acidimicrobiales bacterium]
MTFTMGVFICPIGTAVHVAAPAASDASLLDAAVLLTTLLITDNLVAAEQLRTQPRYGDFFAACAGLRPSHVAVYEGPDGSARAVAFTRCAS